MQTVLLVPATPVAVAPVQARPEGKATDLAFSTVMGQDDLITEAEPFLPDGSALPAALALGEMPPAMPPPDWSQAIGAAPLTAPPNLPDSGADPAALAVMTAPQAPQNERTPDLPKVPAAGGQMPGSATLLPIVATTEFATASLEPKDPSAPVTSGPAGLASSVPAMPDIPRPGSTIPAAAAGDKAAPVPVDPKPDAQATVGPTATAAAPTPLPSAGPPASPALPGPAPLAAETAPSAVRNDPTLPQETAAPALPQPSATAPLADVQKTTASVMANDALSPPSALSDQPDRKDDGLPVRDQKVAPPTDRMADGKDATRGDLAALIVPASSAKVAPLGPTLPPGPVTSARTDAPDLAPEPAVAPLSPIAEPLGPAAVLPTPPRTGASQARAEAFWPREILLAPAPSDGQPPAPANLPGRSASQGATVAALRSPAPAASLPAMPLDAKPLDPLAETDFPLIPGTGASVAAPAVIPPGQTALPSPVPQLVGALVQTLVQRADGTTEIALSPEELGHVRLTLQTDAADPDRMVVLLSFDRPETMDLFRRHAEELAAAMRDAGYARAELSFSQQGAGGFASDHSGASRQEVQAQGPEGPSPVAVGNPAMDTSPTPGRLGAQTGLDLRL